MIEICQLRQQILDCESHALVIGGAGSGKTTIALKKAVKRVSEGLAPGQSTLFLSFSRAAVARIAEASKVETPRDQRSLLSMQTYHSFCWELLRANAYLLGAPRHLQILLPQDERALSGGIDDEDPEWPAWLAERERLFRQEGKIAFDLFAPRAAALLERSKHLLRLIAQRHPLIVVDEAQDTGQDAWRCIELLAPHTQLVCLADLDQQIFDYLPGVGPERIATIRAILAPLQVDLGSQNHRSPGTEILTFGNDILTGEARGGPYEGVSRLSYNPKTHAWNTTLRKALAVLHRHILARTGELGRSVAVLVPNNRNALHLSTKLNAIDGEGGKPVRHKLMFDESEAMLSARLAAFLLEPKQLQDVLPDVARAHELIADAKKATGKGKARVQELMAHAARIRAGKTPKTNLVRSLQSVIESLHADGFTGDPTKDWNSVRRALRDTQQTDLQEIARHLEYLVAFRRGQRIRRTYPPSGCVTVTIRTRELPSILPLRKIRLSKDTKSTMACKS